MVDISFDREPFTALLDRLVGVDDVATQDQSSEAIDDVSNASTWMSHVPQHLTDQALNLQELEQQIQNSLEYTLQGSNTAKAKALQATVDLGAITLSLDEINTLALREAEAAEPLVAQLDGLTQEYTGLMAARQMINDNIIIANSIERVRTDPTDVGAFRDLLHAKKNTSYSAQTQARISKLINDTQRQCVTASAAKLEQVLKRIGWPCIPIQSSSGAQPYGIQPTQQPLDKILDDETVSEFNDAIANHLAMQMEIIQSSKKEEEEEEEEEREWMCVDSGNHIHELVGNLDLVDLILRPLVLRIRFHFGKARQTSRIDKPEWFFTFILKCLRANHARTTATLQPALTRAARTLKNSKYNTVNRVSDISKTAGSGDGNENGSIVVDAQSHITRALVKLVHAKLAHDWPRLAQDLALMSHTISEAFKVDQQLYSEFNYAGASFSSVQSTPLSPISTSKNHVSEIWPLCLTFWSASPVRFRAWMEADHETSLKRLSKVLSSSGAWLSLGDKVGKSAQQAAGGGGTNSGTIGIEDEGHAALWSTTESAVQVLELVHVYVERVAKVNCDDRFLVLPLIVSPLLDRYLDVISKRVAKKNKLTGLAAQQVSMCDLFASLNSAHHVANVVGTWLEEDVDVVSLEEAAVKQRERMRPKALGSKLRDVLRKQAGQHIRNIAIPNLPVSAAAVKGEQVARKVGARLVQTTATVTKDFTTASEGVGKAMGSGGIGSGALFRSLGVTGAFSNAFERGRTLLSTDNAASIEHFRAQTQDSSLFPRLDLSPENELSGTEEGRSGQQSSAEIGQGKDQHQEGLGNSVLTANTEEKSQALTQQKLELNVGQGEAKKKKKNNNNNNNNKDEEEFTADDNPEPSIHLHNDNCGLLDPVLERYQNFVNVSLQDMIVKPSVFQFNRQMTSYFNKLKIWSREPLAHAHASSDINDAVSTLNDTLALFATRCHPDLQHYVVVNLCKELSDVLLSRALAEHVFVEETGRLLYEDVSAVWMGFGRWSKRPDAVFFRRLSNALQVLALPVRALTSLRDTLTNLMEHWDGVEDKSVEFSQLRDVLDHGYGLWEMHPSSVLRICKQRSDV